MFPCNSSKLTCVHQWLCSLSAIHNASNLFSVHTEYLYKKRSHLRSRHRQIPGRRVESKAATKTATCPSVNGRPLNEISSCSHSPLWSWPRDQIPSVFCRRRRLGRGKEKCRWFRELSGEVCKIISYGPPNFRPKIILIIKMPVFLGGGFFFVCFINMSYRRFWNGYRRWKWIRQLEFKSWTRLFAFHITLIPFRKLWI